MEDAQAFRPYAQLGGSSQAGRIDYPATALSRREDAVGSIMERLEHQVMQLAETCQRAERVADALNGPTPQAINAQKGNAPEPGRPPFVVGSLAYINSRLGDRLAELNSSLIRIESALG